MNRSYKYSRFLHVYERDGRVCLYNALTMEAIYSSKREYDHAQVLFQQTKHVGNNTLLRKMKNYNMILPCTVDEELYLDEIRNNTFANSAVKVLKINSTIQSICSLENTNIETVFIDSDKYDIKTFNRLIKESNGVFWGQLGYNF